MKNAYYPPSAEDFKKVRLMSCLSQENASELLHVTVKTIKNWEKGRVTIPYSAFKLLKVLSRYELPQEGWQGWHITNGKLWSPAGRSFLPYELSYVSNYFTMARHWLSDREANRKLRSMPKAPVLSIVKHAAEPSVKKLIA